MSSPEWLDTVLHVAEPVGGLVIGFALTVLRYRRRMKQFSETQKTDRAAVETYKKALEKMIGDAVNSVRAAAIEGDKAASLQFEQRLVVLSQSLGAQIKMIQEDLEKLEEEQTDQFRSSAHDHAASSALARDMLEVRDQCDEVLALMNEIKGYLRASGVKF